MAAFVRCDKHNQLYNEGTTCAICTMEHGLADLRALQDQLTKAHGVLVERIAAVEQSIKTVEGHVLTAVQGLNQPSPAKGERR